MQDRSDPKRLTRLPRPALLVVATLLTGVLVAACGGSSGGPSAATMDGAKTSLATVAAAAGSSTAAGASAQSTQPASPAGMNATALAFSRCMRANGVPNFPDPNPGGGFLFPVNGLDRSSPAFKTAQAKCQKLLPKGGPPGPGTRTHPSAETLRKLLKIAQCMRGHGVPEFPDPRTSVPANPFSSGGGVITDYDGAILLFPSTLDMHAPAYTQAVAACGTLAGKLGRGPHS
jgi:hypothetical protein